MNKVKKTRQAYGFLWEKSGSGIAPSKWHFNDIQDLIPEPIVKGKIGIDIGSGCGYDTYIMAIENPLVKIVSLDISDGIYKTNELVSELRNTYCIKGSALEIPIKDNTFDFAYSYGVLHHTADPEKAIREILKVIKKGATLFLYLYEDHSDDFVKYLAIKMVTILRKITIKIPPKMLYMISYLVSPIAVVLFSYPALFFKKFKATEYLADKMPFNFCTHPFSLAADLYDRFSAPLEYRFSRKEVFDLLDKNCFTNIKVERLKSKAGWVTRGTK